MSKNQTLFQKGGLFLVLGAVSLVLTGCGTNVFETLEQGESFSYDTPEESVESLQTRLGDTRSPNEFAQIQEIAQELLDDDDVSDEIKQDAAVIKGESILGKNELSLLNLASSVFELTDDGLGGFSSSVIAKLEGDDDENNIFEIMRDIIENTSTPDLVEAANAFNFANDFFEQNSIFELPKKVQLIRGVANALASIKVLTGPFILDETTGVTYRSGLGEDDIITIMDGIFDINQDGDTTDRITLYATEMHDGFTRAELPDDMSDELDRIKLMADDFNQLYAQMQLPDGTYNTRAVGENAGANRKSNINSGVNDIVRNRLGRD